MTRILASLRTGSGWKLAVAWILVTVICVLSPSMGLSQSLMREAILIASLAMVVAGLNISLGYTGELALGQSAMYAAGAYTTAYVATNLINDLFVTLALSATVALLMGILTGVPGLRVGGWLLAVSSFFLVLLIPPVLNIFGDKLGGYEGFTGIPIPKLFGHELDNTQFFILVIVVTSLWFAAFRNLVKSRHGDAFRIAKTSPVLTESLGISVYRIKLRAYAISGIPAGIAGTVAAYLDGFISPSSFGLDFAIAVLAASILGGSMSVYGALFGAALIVELPLRVTAFRDYALVGYGVLLIVGGTLLSGGVTGLFNRRRRTSAPAEADASPAPVGASVVPTVLPRRRLKVEGVHKAFGGNHALTDVSLIAEPGQVTALIGPNGSGKTTLMNVICGYYGVDSGAIYLDELRLTGLMPPKISVAGVGRTFQTPLVPKDMTVRDCTITGLFATQRTSMLTTVLRLPKYHRDLRRVQALADRTLRELGLGHLSAELADSMPLGTRRMLEMARVIVGEKPVVLFDEVASGIDESEIEGLVRVIDALRSNGATVLLVEHNFSLVRRLADQVYVLAEGVVIASGPVSEIESHPEVLAKYLGAGVAVTGTRSKGNGVTTR
jgi:branched-chain amino acid transport system permease protein